MTTKTGRRMAGVLVFVAGLAMMFYMNTLLVSRSDQHNNDYACFWAAGRVMVNGGSPYDPVAYKAVQESIGRTRVDLTIVALPYPLWTIALFAPLGLLDVETGAALWLMLNEILIALVFFLIGQALVHNMPPPEARRTFNTLLQWGFVPFLVSFPFMHCLLNGQFSIISTACVALFIWAAVTHHYKIAGAALLIVMFKPTVLLIFAPVALLWLLARRERWPGLMVFGAGAALLLAFGFGLDPQMLHHMSIAETEIGRWFVFRSATMWGLGATAARALGLAEMVGWVLAGLIALLVCGLSLWLVRGLPDDGRGLTLRWSLVLLLSLNLTFYALSYESVAILVPVLALVAVVRDYRPTERWVIGIAALITIWIVPHAIHEFPVQERTAGIYPALALLLILAVLVYDRRRPVPHAVEMESQLRIGA